MSLSIRKAILLLATLLQVIAWSTLLNFEVAAAPASMYGHELVGNLKADGTPYDPWELGVAHKTLPFGTLVELCNNATGQCVVAPVNDRGPYVGDREWDMSLATAHAIGHFDGVADVTATVL